MERPITSTESLYLAIEASVGSFAMIRAVQGEFYANRCDQEAIQTAWQQSIHAHPHFRSVLRGRSWVDAGETFQPALEVVAARMDLHLLPHLRALDCSMSAICLWLYEDGFVFQASHSLTDGVGIQRLIHTFFDALRSVIRQEQNTARIKVIPVQQQYIDERSLAKLLGVKPTGFLPRWDKRFQAQVHIAGSSIRDMAAWRSRSIPLAHLVSPGDNKLLLSQILLKTARWMQECHPNKSVRCMLPVDLRKYGENPWVDGNLSLPLWLEITGRESASDLSQDIRSRIKNREPLQQADPIPMNKTWLQNCRNWLFIQLIKWSHRRHRYALNMIVSYLGKYDQESYSYGGFRCDSVWSSALFSGISPLQMHVTHDDQSVYFHISYQRQLFTEAQIENLFKQLKHPTSLV